MVWAPFLLCLALSISHSTSMQPNGGGNGGFGAVLSPSTSSLDSIDSLADCTDSQRDELTNIIDFDGPLRHVLSLATDAVLSGDQYHKDKFRQHFLSLYSEYKRDVETWFYTVLYQLYGVQTRRFKIQCHGDDELQCPPHVFAVTDHSKRGIILVIQTTKGYSQSEPFKLI